MGTSSEIVRAFLNAFYAGDGRSARAYLADDLSFTGPSATFKSADEYVRVSAHVASGVKRLEMHKLFEDGPEVGAFYDLVIDQTVGLIPVAEWYQVSGDHIVSIRLIMDTAPFVAQATDESEPSQDDPVCHMRVQPSSAAASRQHQDVIYYFCSSGCAAAFEAEPDVYITRAR